MDSKWIVSWLCFLYIIIYYYHVYYYFMIVIFNIIIIISIINKHMNIHLMKGDLKACASDKHR